MNIDVNRVWRDLHDGKVEAVPTASRSIAPSISGDGRLVAFQAASEAGHQDVFVYDRDIRETHCLGAPLRAVAPAMEGASPVLSSDGRSVVYEARLGDGAASQIVRGRDGRHELLSGNAQGEPSNGHAQSPALSADGNVVAFKSGASNLAPIMSFRTNIFAREGASLECITGHANGDSSGVALSADGRYVAYASGRSATQPGQVDRPARIHVHDLQTDASVVVDQAPACSPAMSADGMYLAFGSVKTTQGVYVVRNTISEDLRKKVLDQAVADALAREQQPAPQVVRADDYIEVGGVRVPRRA